jgi:hypothetical protein
MNASAGSRSWSVYGSIKDLILDRFVDYLEHKDPRILVKSGNPPMHALQETALELLGQYQEALKNIHSQHHKRLMEDVESMGARIDRVTMLCTALKSRYSLPIIEELRIDDFDYPFAPDSYLSDIEKVEMRLKSELVRLRVREKQLKDLEEQSSGKKMTRQDFIRHLQLASKMDGVHYQIRKVYVEEYCSFINRLTELSKSSKNNGATS